MIYHIFYESLDNFIEARELTNPNRLHLIDINHTMMQIKEVIHTADKVKLIVGPTETKKK